MFNRDEILYNSRSIISVWSENEKDIDNVLIEANFGKETQRYDFGKSYEDCAIKMTDLLTANNGCKSISIFVKHGTNTKKLGTIDIE